MNRKRLAYLGDLAPYLATVLPNEQTGSYTLAISDAGASIDVNTSSPATITVPATSAVAFPIGTVVEILQYGTGQVTVAAAGGVTLLTSSSLTTRARYSSLSVRKRADNEWVVSGDLT